MSSSMYAQLASLLTYPEEGYHDKLRAAIAAAPASCATDLMEFGASALAMKLEELQERFTAVFDLNPKGTLDLGWHLFGEKYERGLLLVRMRQQLARYGIAETTELPDHLTHALLLLDAMHSERNRCDSLSGSAHIRPAEENPAADFLGAILLPALAKILCPAPTRQAKSGLAGDPEESAPYDLLLKAVDSFLRAEFPEVEAEPLQATLPILESSQTHAAGVCAGTMGDHE